MLLAACQNHSHSRQRRSVSMMSRSPSSPEDVDEMLALRLARANLSSETPTPQRSPHPGPSRLQPLAEARGRADREADDESVESEPILLSQGSTRKCSSQAPGSSSFMALSTDSTAFFRTGPTATSQSGSSQGSSQGSSRGGRGRARARSASTASVRSLTEASSEIDFFFSNFSLYRSSSRLSVRDQKLRFWQSLLIELGICDAAPDDHDHDEYSSDSSNGSGSGGESTDSDSGNETETEASALRRAALARARRAKMRAKAAGRASNGTIRIPLPTSLSACRKLLKRHAKVNLVDFVSARERRRVHIEACPGSRAATAAPLDVKRFPNDAQLIKYTQKTGKFYR